MKEDPKQSDAQFVADVRGGDLDAFRKIVLRYSNALLAVGYSVLGDFHEAQDVAQEAFVKGYTSLHALQDPSRLGSWLYAIAYRTSLDFRKKKKTALSYHETSPAASESIPSWIDQHAMRDAIWRALQTLESHSKSAVVLHYLSDWSMGEIGHFLNVSTSAVESRIRRAREKLKHVLADDYERYFRPHRLDRHFEQQVVERLQKRIGHFYIPVTHKQQTIAWFIAHFHLGISPHGHLQLESDHELYLLECYAHAPRAMPVLLFAVADLEDLWGQLTANSVKTDPMETLESFGMRFAFYDPDGNQYHAIENI